MAVEKSSVKKAKKPHFGKKETESYRKEEYTEEGQLRKWRLVDASAMPVGRLASKIASVLRGKHYPYYTPHVDCGDYVVVINAEKAVLTGNKMADKVYYTHSGYTGGIKAVTAEDMIRRKPENVVYQAVKRMMPRSPLNRKSLLKLKIVTGANHPFAAHKPESMDFARIPHLKTN